MARRRPRRCLPQHNCAVNDDATWDRQPKPLAGKIDVKKKHAPPVCRTERRGRAPKDTWSRRQHPGAEYRLKFVKTNGAARRPARSLSDYRPAHAIAGIDPGRAFASDRNRAAHNGYYHAAYGARWAQRKPDPDHGRRSHVKLSAMGQNLNIERYGPKKRFSFSYIFDRLPVTDATTRFT
jgi:hypothetical protein